MAQQIINTSRLSQRTSGAAINANFSELYARGTRLEAISATAAGTLVVPAGHAIEHIYISGNNANAVNGGIKIGTSAGGTQVLAFQAVPGNSLTSVPDGNIVARVFSKTIAQTIYYDAVTSWSSANVDLIVVLRKVW